MIELCFFIELRTGYFGKKNQSFHLIFTNSAYIKKYEKEVVLTNT